MRHATRGGRASPIEQGGDVALHTLTLELKLGDVVWRIKRCGHRHAGVDGPRRSRHHHRERVWTSFGRGRFAPAKLPNAATVTRIPMASQRDARMLTSLANTILESARPHTTAPSAQRQRVGQRQGTRRAPSGFSLFCRALRAKVCCTHATCRRCVCAVTAVPFPQADAKSATRGQRLWKEMGADEKKAWRDMAELQKVGRALPVPPPGPPPSVPAR